MRCAQLCRGGLLALTTALTIATASVPAMIATTATATMTNTNRVTTTVTTLLRSCSHGERLGTLLHSPCCMPGSHGVVTVHALRQHVHKLH